MTVQEGNPYCQFCRSDEDLVVEGYEPAYEEPIVFQAWQGAVQRSVTVQPSVRYRCQRCGNRGQVQVARDWQPPT